MKPHITIITLGVEDLQRAGVVIPAISRIPTVFIGRLHIIRFYNSVDKRSRLMYDVT